MASVKNQDICLETVGIIKESNQSSSSIQGQYKKHGPIYLVPLFVYLGSTARTVKKLHEAALSNDKISGFFTDEGKHAKRYFYLENVNPRYTIAEYNMHKTGQTPTCINKDASVCKLHQPHQPPMVSFF